MLSHRQQPYPISFDEVDEANILSYWLSVAIRATGQMLLTLRMLLDLSLFLCEDFKLRFTQRIEVMKEIRVLANLPLSQR